MLKNLYRIGPWSLTDLKSSPSGNNLHNLVTLDRI